MKNYFIKTLVVLILAFSIPSVSQAARTDGVWDNFGTYMKTVIPAGLDVLINGANHYLNFGSVSGTSGYGIRDNAGVIECKNSGGAWGACAGSGSGGGSGGGAWATNTPNTLTYLTTQWTALIGGTASTTIGNIFEVLGNGYFSGGLQSIRSTTTNATTTTFAVTGTATSTFGGAINSPCFFTNGGCLSTTTPGTGFSTTSADFWISATTSLPKLTDLGGLLRSTSTQATSTNLFSTTASTTALYLATGVCSGTNALTIGTDGKVVCGAITGSGGGTQFPTSTNPLMATYFVATGTATSTFKTAIEVGNGVATSTFIPGPGTSTPGGGINIPNNCYAIAGTCISGAIASVFGRIGVVVATAGDYTTAQVTEVTNLYFTNARAIAATLTGYVSGAGTITAADTVLSAIQKLNGNVGALVTGVSSVFGRTGAVVAQSGDYTTTQVTEGTNLYYTQTRFDNALTATTSLPKLTDLGGLLRSTTTQSTSTYLFATQASSSNLYLGNGSCASGQTLVINASGQVVCAAFVGGSAASSTLLTDQNTFSSASNTINFLNNIRSTTTQATTTSLAVSGVSSAIMLTNAGGSVSGYTGTTCTNQFVRILSALGVATCATVANTDLANSSLTISTAGGLLGGGTVSLGGTITITDPKQIATTTPTIGQLAYFTGVTPTSLGSVATNTVTCTGNATCATFTALASAPVTINVAAGTAASSTLLADNNTFSGINIFNNILRSTSTQSTSTNFFSQFAFIPQATDRKSVV